MYNMIELVFIVQSRFSPFVYNIQNSIQSIKNTYKELFAEDSVYKPSTALFPLLGQTNVLTDITVCLVEIVAEKYLLV